MMETYHKALLTAWALTILGAGILLLMGAIGV